MEAKKPMEQMDLTESALSREEIFKGKIFTVHVDQVRLPNGDVTKREAVEHKGGVAVVALDDDGNVLTVTQYRYVFGRLITEIPAGKLDKEGEDPRSAALRELREETGMVPDSFESLGRILPTPGYDTEILYLYLARGLHMEGQRLDPDEFLQVDRVPFAEMVNRCMDGDIEDAKTVAAILKAKIRLGL